MEEFRDFLISPFHNKKSMVVRLFDVIRKKGPEFIDDSLEKEMIWEKIYPGKPYNYGVMKNLIHDLTKLAENFISYLKYEESPGFHRNMLESLHERNVTEIFINKLIKFKKHIEKSNLNEFSKLENLTFYYELRSYCTKFPMDDSYNIANELKTKEKFSSLNMMNAFLPWYLQSANVVTNYDISVYKDLLDFLYNNFRENESSDIIKLYSLFLVSIEDINDTSKFDELRMEFKNRKDALHHKDKFRIYELVSLLYEMNFRNGVRSYDVEYLNHWFEVVDKQVYTISPKGYLDLITFRNVLILCRRTESTDIMEKFIEIGIEKVNPAVKDTLYNYSCAVLYYEKDEYEKVLEYEKRTVFSGLLNSDKENLYFKMDLKTITLKSSYELELFEEVFSQIDSFKHFLRNTVLIPANFKELRYDFLKCLNELTKLRISYNEYALRSLSTRVESTRDGWLIKKVNDYLSQYSGQQNTEELQSS